MNDKTKAPSAMKADAIRNKLQLRNNAEPKNESGAQLSDPEAVDTNKVTHEALDNTSGEAQAPVATQSESTDNPVVKRRGRPKKSDQVKTVSEVKDRVTFTIAVSREDYKKVSILAGKKQVETGEPFSAQKFIKETLTQAIGIKFL